MRTAVLIAFMWYFMLPTAAITTGTKFPYEQTVMSKLSRMSKAEAVEYLDMHSTRYMLREVGVPDSKVAAARKLLSNGEIKEMTGSVVPLVRKFSSISELLDAPVLTNWPALGGSGAWHSMRGPWPKTPAREQWTPPPGWQKPSKPVTSWYDQGLRLYAKPAVIASDKMFLDESAALAAAAFPIDEATLIQKAKTFLYYNQGIERPELLAESFAFMGPVVGGAGGLSKTQFLEAVGGFNLYKAFPDLNPRFHHFRADPLDPGRVWFTSQASGTDNGEGFLGNKPTGKSFLTPPQACSVKFNAAGLVIKYTIGHVMERSIGNTGGLGGIFGPAYAIGKALPFPEAQPWKPSKRYRALMLIGKLSTWLKERKQPKP